MAEFQRRFLRQDDDGLGLAVPDQFDQRRLGRGVQGPDLGREKRKSPQYREKRDSTHADNGSVHTIGPPENVFQNTDVSLVPLAPGFAGGWLRQHAHSYALHPMQRNHAGVVT